VWLLPYIEQDNVWKQYNPQLHFGHANNRNAIQVQIKTFYCPATPEQPRTDTFNATTGGTYSNPIEGLACSDYSPMRAIEASLVSQFPNAVDQGVYTNDESRWGPHSYNSGSTIRVRRWASVTDGLSNTILYIEDAGRPKEWVANHRPSGSRASGGGWADQAAEFGLHGCTPPNDTRPGLQPINCTNDGEPYAFHPNGCNAAMCDGSVRFLSQGIPIRIFARLVTAQAGEVVGDF
jgi:prepilin-type processing-associated H-X9-DG protein